MSSDSIEGIPVIIRFKTLFDGFKDKLHLRVLKVFQL